MNKFFLLFQFKQLDLSQLPGICLPLVSLLPLSAVSSPPVLLRGRFQRRCFVPALADASFVQTLERPGVHVQSFRVSCLSPTPVCITTSAHTHVLPSSQPRQNRQPSSALLNPTIPHFPYNQNFETWRVFQCLLWVQLLSRTSLFYSEIVSLPMFKLCEVKLDSI